MKIIYNVQCSIHEAAAVAVCSGAPQLDDAMPIEWRMDRLFECAPHKLSIETARRHRVSIKIYCTFDLAAVRGARHKTILGKWLNYWFLCVLCQGAVPLMFLFFAVLFFFCFVHLMRTKHDCNRSASERSSNNNKMILLASADGALRWLRLSNAPMGSGTSRISRIWNCLIFLAAFVPIVCISACRPVLSDGLNGNGAAHLDVGEYGLLICFRSV